MSEAISRIQQVLSKCTTDNEFAFQFAVMVFQYLEETGLDDIVWEATYEYFETNKIPDDRLAKVHDLTREMILSYKVEN